MILFVLVIVVALVLGLILGGRPSHLGSLRLRWWGLVLAGLGLQFVPLPQGAGGTDLVVRTIVLSISYTLLVAFAAANLRVAGVAIVMLGLAMNFTVIAANGSMPVSENALRASGQGEIVAALQAQGADKHHLMTDDDVLTFLADVIAVPQPIAQAVSIGDVFIYAGLIWALVAAMRGRTPSSSAGWGPYRGRHRPGEAPQPEVHRDLGFLPAATRSGTAR